MNIFRRWIQRTFLGRKPSPERRTPTEHRGLEDRITRWRYYKTCKSIAFPLPSASSLNATSVTYAVTSNESVAGVDATDFQVVKSGALPEGQTKQQLPCGCQGSGALHVPVNGIHGNGALQLNTDQTTIDSRTTLPV